MAKVEVYTDLRRSALLVACCFLVFNSYSQYELQLKAMDKDSAFLSGLVRVQTSFRTRQQCSEYLFKLPAQLQLKGYMAASVDSIMYDSSYAAAFIYIGDKFTWAQLNTDSVDKKLLDAINWNKKEFDKKPMSWQQYNQWQQRILNYLENNGYPFAQVMMDSIVMGPEGITAKLKVDKGPLYKTDSIRNYGEARISNRFLQRYLGIMNGNIYRKERLTDISRKLNELPYLQEQQRWDMTWLGTGSILNLYLSPKRSSQVNVLVGFLPASPQPGGEKLVLTGEANINLKNALGNGESIGVNWQQLQVKSPRLNLSYQQPFLFGSPFGITTVFDLFKKDSSFLNINFVAGMQYAFSSRKSGNVFLQLMTTNLLTVDTNAVIQQRKLPSEADVNSVNLGVGYEWNNTNYRFNPRSGNEVFIAFSTGTKTVEKNDVIVQLTDKNDPGFDFNSLYDTIKLKSYQFRIKLNAAHFFPLGRVSTLKTGLYVGWFQSPNIFRNELFQIGGYKLLRGFDEESIYASQYITGTLEYRYLIGRNSYLFSFLDGGWAGNTSNSQEISNSFIGGGLGLALETKAGIFNISYAAGKRNDTDFNIRQSKIHLGYVNFF